MSDTDDDSNYEEWARAIQTAEDWLKELNGRLDAILKEINEINQQLKEAQNESKIKE